MDRCFGPGLSRTAQGSHGHHSGAPLKSASRGDSENIPATDCYSNKLSDRKGRRAANRRRNHTIVEIQPSNPEVIYVPSYPPNIYYPTPYYGYGSPYYGYGYYPYAPLVTFGV